MPKAAEQAIETQTSSGMAIVPVNAPPADRGFAGIIEKVSMMENIDVDKLERMMAMQMQWEERNARKLFDEAKARASAKLKNIKVVKTRSVGYDVDKNDKTKGQKEAFKYAALEDIDKLIAPVLEEEGIDVSYKIEPSNIPGWHTVVCWLAHAGHREPYPMPMPLDVSGGKGNAQAMGSTQMYGMRRALCGAFNIIPIGVDNDAIGEAISDEQAAEIKAGLKETDYDVKAFLKYMKAENVEEIRARYYKTAMMAINAKRYELAQGKGQANAGAA